jgi:signal peptidase I
VQLKSLVYKFWYALWFVILPLIIAWLIVDVAARTGVIEEIEIWYVLLCFACLAFVTHSARDKFPFWQDPDPTSEHNRSRRRQEAGLAARHVRKVLRKNGKKVTAKGKAELESLLAELEASIANKDDERLTKQLRGLEEKSDRHLAFARKSAGREYFESIGVAVLIAVLLRLFVFEAFKIPSESMVPTLMVGDHIFVNKYIYGLSLPFSHARMVRFNEPRHGEVIVFIKPEREYHSQELRSILDPNELGGKDFIKRIVGLPGDTVEMRDDALFVNGKELPRCRVGTQVYRANTGRAWEDKEDELWIEKHGDYLYSVLESRGHVQSFPPMTVPHDEVFVLGDNRDNSNDSRYWGSVPFDNIKGRSMIIWWSNLRPYGFQWDRVGRSIMSPSPVLNEDQAAGLARCANLR